MSDPILDAIRQALRAELSEFLKDFAPAVSKPAFLSTEALAKELDVCTKTIDRLRAKGCPFVLVGDNCPRFDLADVRAWLKSRTSAT